MVCRAEDRGAGRSPGGNLACRWAARAFSNGRSRPTSRAASTAHSSPENNPGLTEQPRPTPTHITSNRHRDQPWWGRRVLPVTIIRQWLRQGATEFRTQQTQCYSAAGQQHAATTRPGLQQTRQRGDIPTRCAGNGRHLLLVVFSIRSLLLRRSLPLVTVIRETYARCYSRRESSDLRFV